MDPFANILRRLPASLPPSAGSLDSDAGVRLAWTLAAGPALAARSRVADLCPRQGILTVWTADATTRQLLASVAVELLRSLNQMLGDGRVHRLSLTGDCL